VPLVRRPYRPAPEPLDVDPVPVVVAGTVIWAVATVVLLPFAGALDRSGRLWWLAVTGCGFVLGLAGVWFVRRRRTALQRAAGRRRDS